MPEESTPVVEEQDTNTITIDEPVEEEAKAEEIDLGVLPTEEQELIKKHDLLPKEEESDEHEKQPESKTDEDTNDKEAEEEKVEEHPTFEDVDQNKDLLKKYNKNEQALYFKYKSDKRKRQKAEQKIEELTAEKELTSLKETFSTKKLDKIKEKLTSGEVTVEEIQAILDLQQETPAKAKPVNPQDELVKVVKDRLASAEEIGITKYEDFQDQVELASEIFQKKPIYQKQFDTMIRDESVDEDDIVEFVMDIAKLNPSKAKKEEVAPEQQEKVERAVKNAKKAKSSAQVSGGKGRRVVSYDDLTIEDIASMDTKQYMKIPKDVRDRILKEAEK
jgi:hypothetical protein